MQVRQPTYKTKDGERRHSARWHVRFRDHLGVRRRLLASTDKPASEEYGRNLDRLAGYAKSGGELPEDLRGWIEGLNKDVRNQLVGWAMLSRTQASVGTSLERHIGAYHAILLARDKTKGHADLVRTRLRRTNRACGFSLWREIDAGKIETWLAAERGAGRLKTNTTNHYTKAVAGFCGWMLDQKLAATVPAKIVTVAVTDEESFGAFTVEQINVLLDYCERTSDIWGWSQDTPVQGERKRLPRRFLTGPQRAFVYRMGIETAQRAGTLRKMTVGQVRFDRDAGGTVSGGIIRTTVGQQKNRRPFDVPLRQEFAAELADRLHGKAPAMPVVEVPPWVAAMLRNDLFNAGLPLIDEDGQRLLYHSFRVTSATWLGENGATEKEIQAITGHVSTASVQQYTHTTRKLGRKAVEMLPKLERRRA